MEKIKKFNYEGIDVTIKTDEYGSTFEFRYGDLHFAHFPFASMAEEAARKLIQKLKVNDVMRLEDNL